jgi:hypothetical protein
MREGPRKDGLLVGIRRNGNIGVVPSDGHTFSVGANSLVADSSSCIGRKVERPWA